MRSKQGAFEMLDSVRKKVRSFAVVGIGFLIRGYQVLVRPHLFGSCKFCPTCSEYALEALHRHGLVRGAGFSLRRLIRCHPFGIGGIDPVPLS